MKVRQLVCAGLVVALSVFTGLAMAQEPQEEPATTEEPAATPTPPTAKPEKTKVKLADLPDPVQKAVKAQTKGIKAYELVKEVSGENETYELKLKVKGLTKEVEFDKDGNLVATEQEVKLASLPAKLKKALTAAAGKGKILKVESVTKGTTVTYEAKVKTGKETSEIEVDAEGAAINHHPNAD